jgi:hypothetical protein
VATRPRAVAIVTCLGLNCCSALRAGPSWSMSRIGRSPSRSEWAGSLEGSIGRFDKRLKIRVLATAATRYADSIGISVQVWIEPAKGQLMISRGFQGGRRPAAILPLRKKVTSEAPTARAGTITVDNHRLASRFSDGRLPRCSRPIRPRTNPEVLDQ